MEKSWAYPVVANGRLLVRDHGTLWCYDVVAAKGAYDGRSASLEPLRDGAFLDPPALPVRQAVFFPLFSGKTARN
jgi:hypothetical protein